MKNWRVGSRVQWKWLGRPIIGKVVEVFHDRVQKTIKGKVITRNGSKESPAYLVVSEAGNEALKLGTELTKVESTKRKGAQPKMFRD